MNPIVSFSGPYRFLSDFYPSVLQYQRHVFPTVEHAYQAAKTISPADFAAILAAKSPGEAKRLGRRCRIRADWDEVKLDVMLTCLRAKFADVALGQRLLATGTSLLVEGNTWADRYWGQCPVGVGENWLGRLLMQVRSELGGAGS